MKIDALAIIGNLGGQEMVIIFLIVPALRSQKTSAARSGSRQEHGRIQESQGRI